VNFKVLLLCSTEDSQYGTGEVTTNRLFQTHEHNFKELKSSAGFGTRKILTDHFGINNEAAATLLIACCGDIWLR